MGKEMRRLGVRYLKKKYIYNKAIFYVKYSNKV